VNLRRAVASLAFLIVTLAALDLPALAGPIDYRALILVEDGSGTSLGYVQNDPNYWTPQLTPDSSSAMIVDFTLNGTSGSQINIKPENTNESAFPDLGLVVGRDSTSSNIASGNFNYLYLDNTDATNPGATPQSAPNYFATQNGLNKQSESAVWAIDVNALTIDPVWIDPDSSTPTTDTFVQSNHLYAGGDPNAFLSRFPAPVTPTTLHLDILSAVPEQTTAVPEPASWSLLLGGLVSFGIFRRSNRLNRTGN
jgi:hypothetical protein